MSAGILSRREAEEYQRILPQGCTLYCQIADALAADVGIRTLANGVTISTRPTLHTNRFHHLQEGGRVQCGLAVCNRDQYYDDTTERWLVRRMPMRIEALRKEKELQYCEVIRGDILALVRDAEGCIGSLECENRELEERLIHAHADAAVLQKKLEGNELALKNEQLKLPDIERRCREFSQSMQRLNDKKAAYEELLSDEFPISDDARCERSLGEKIFFAFLSPFPYSRKVVSQLEAISRERRERLEQELKKIVDDQERVKSLKQEIQKCRKDLREKIEKTKREIRLQRMVVEYLASEKKRLGRELTELRQFHSHLHEFRRKCRLCTDSMESIQELICEDISRRQLREEVRQFADRTRAFLGSSDGKLSVHGNSILRHFALLF